MGGAGRQRAGMQIEVVRLRTDCDIATLKQQWRALEACADGSFFQSWTWIGCRLRSRFTDPHLVRATVDGPGGGGPGGSTVVGLALFNRGGPRLLPTLWLHETGRAAEDSVFIEHNGPLLARGHEALLRPMLQAASRHGRLVLSGVGDRVREAAGSLGWCQLRVTRPAPYVALDTVDAAGWLATLGSSTRYQLRRSRRGYEAEGAVRVRRAADVEEGLRYLGELAALHQARWLARGHPGAFAEPAFAAFHRTLVARGLPRGEVDLLRIAAATPAGERVIGYLYNLRWRQRIYAYQGGFDYAAAGTHHKPGLTCHHAVIEAAIAAGYATYDFLAGQARYKTSLGNRTQSLHWLKLHPPRSLYGLLTSAGHTLVRRLPHRLRGLNGLAGHEEASAPRQSFVGHCAPGP